jgi:hypothetical protein
MQLVRRFKALQPEGPKRKRPSQMEPGRSPTPAHCPKSSQSTCLIEASIALAQAA